MRWTLFFLVACRPDLGGYPIDDEHEAQFFGVSTLLFDDGETAILTDGFFSRPGMLSVLFKVAPDAARIPPLPKLAAVIPLHHHYDHAMDSAFVARKTGAELLASPHLGGRLPRETETYGRFKLTFVESAHVPSDAFPGLLEEDITPPARISAYRTDKCWSLYVEHDARTSLVQGSAGIVKGALKKPADTVYLGIGLLARQSADYREDYWQETVRLPQAKRVVLIHWDDFFQKEIVPMPTLFDDVKLTIDEMMAKGKRDGIEVVLARLAAH